MSPTQQNINPNTQNTDPVLAFTVNEKVGRLYRKPDFVLPENINNIEVVKQLIIENKLFPSTTNVLGVQNKPYLLPWAAKMVAEEMLTMIVSNPQKTVERIQSNYYGALKYFKNVPTKIRDTAGTQGSNIHLGCELLSLNKPINHLTFTAFEQAAINKFKDWLDLFQPNIEYTEITGYGQTKEKNMGYANTTDVIATINKTRIIGDYKCVVDDTPILMEDGSVKTADKIVEGDRVVAWDKTNGLHASTVSYAGDNGFHQVVTVTTTSGHNVTTTLNHPFYSAQRNQKTGWVKAEDLKVGDELFVAMGWNYNQNKVDTVWPYNKNLSPYLLGVLWAIRNYSRQNIQTEPNIVLPKISRPGLREELEAVGFLFNKKGELNTAKGFAKIMRKNSIDEETFFGLIDTDQLPNFLFSASRLHISAFITGIKEVFGNKTIYEEELYVVLNKPALHNLQQLFSNYGQPATVMVDHKTGLAYLKVPYENDNTIYAHGPTVTKISSIQITEEKHHTVAIEVAGSHTHITGGLITHNTNRSGLSNDVSLQLAANNHNSVLAVGDETLVPHVPAEVGLGIHISPNKVTTKRVSIDESVFDTFCALREVWELNVFEGKLRSAIGLLQEEIFSPEDL